MTTWEERPPSAACPRIFCRTRYGSEPVPHGERRATPRLPRDSVATVTTWNAPDEQGMHWVRHHGITDGNRTIEYPTRHAAVMAAYIHNVVRTHDGNQGG